METLYSSRFTNVTTFIGKGDHQITANIDIYPMNSTVFDFGNVRFQSGSTPFVIHNTSIPWQYVDDKLVQRHLLVSGASRLFQYLAAGISLTKPTSNIPGHIYLSGTLSDRYGRSPHRLNQVIACWHENGDCCQDTIIHRQALVRELPPIGCIRVFLSLTIEPGTNIYNSVELYFTTEDNIPLVRCYKFGAQAEDHLYLYPLLTEMRLCRQDAVFVARDDGLPHGYVTMLHVYSIDYTIPSIESLGQIRMRGRAMSKSGPPFYFHKVIATYDRDGNIRF